MSESRTALVTGGARGIGLEICRQLAERGLRVLVAARQLEAAEGRAAPLAWGRCHWPWT